MSDDWVYAPNLPQVYEKEPPERPILYGPKGEPLHKPKIKLGFQPPDKRGRIK